MFARLIFGVALATGLATATTVSAAPAPSPAPTAQGPLAYYVMMGNTIMSPPFTDPNACMKAVAKLQKDPQWGKDMIVCAHRRP